MKSIYYREQKHICGKNYATAPYMEVDLYPVTQKQHNASRRAKRKEASTLAQQTYNDNRAKRYHVQLVNANFGKHPNTGYDAFTNALIRQIGAALEIPPEVLFKQFTTSYSAARGALNEFWRTCSMQRDWFTDDFCQPIYEEWFAEAVARGRIAAPGFFADPAIRKAYTACAWNGPARTNLNPVQEVDAAVKRVDAGFSTAQEETATMTGGDYNRNIRQRVIEAKRKREVDEITNPQAKPPGGQQEE